MESNLNKLSEDWADLKEVILYGFGKEGIKNFDKIARDFRVKCIIDNDISKTDTCYKGIPVLSMEDAKEKLKSYKVIVMTASRAYRSIAVSLMEKGLSEYENFCGLEQFTVEWYWKYRNQINIFEIHQALTTRCTLNCRNCNMFIPYYTETHDYSFEEIKEDLDSLFRRIDFIFNYELLGGEPFLNKDLMPILQYMTQRYKSRIGHIGIITNGTVIPKPELLNFIKENNIGISISDYSNVVHYQNTLNTFIEKLSKKKIDFLISKEMVWRDFGFPDKKYYFNNVREHMLNCGPVFHGLNDKKLYFCHVSWSAEKCGLIHLDKDEFISLEEVNERDDEERKKIAEYSLGFWKKGYLDMCRICGGCGVDNEHLISAGIQTERSHPER